MSGLFNMHHYDLTVPETLNNGHPSHYVDAMRESLPALGYDGWTETRGEGAWHGEIERVTVFTFYVSEDGWRQRMHRLGITARIIMADQEAIQVVDHGEVTVAEF